MSSFSDRMGLTSSQKEIQLDCINEPLSNRLWNIYNMYVMNKIEPTNSRYFIDTYRRLTWHNLFKESYDDAPYHFSLLKEHIKDYFFSEEWYKVYNLIEFALTIPHFEKQPYINAINLVLEQEYSGYRFIDELITPISNSIETETIETALETTQLTFDGHANIHLSQALKFISDKPNPDYRNSIKESISAVGTVLRKITGKNSFGDGLKYLEQSGLKINSQFKEGLNKFYNYTNDPTTGIRHEILTAHEPPDFETAKFMLLSCSAFINYIVPLAQKAGINTKP